MIDFPSPFAGAVTIVALIGLGVIVYPFLLKLSGGVALIGAATVMLTFVFYTFDSSRAEPIAPSAWLALLWALAPVAAAAAVHRLSRRGAESGQ